MHEVFSICTLSIKECQIYGLHHFLDLGIDIAPGIDTAPPLEIFHIIILIHFHINLGIVVIL